MTVLMFVVDAIGVLLHVLGVLYFVVVAIGAWTWPPYTWETGYDR